jgi:hypothetical protein
VRSRAGFQLYDLENDPTESTDISGANAALVAELKTLLLAERVAEPQWSANTYHDWTGADGANVSDATNWSDYVYENKGIVYDTDSGVPRIPWVAKMENKNATDQTAILDTNTETLSIEIAGNIASRARQTISFKPGRKLTGRNEIRLSPLSEVELNGGTLASNRWVDVFQGAVLEGFGTVAATLYNEGTVSITSGTTGLTVNGDYRQSAIATLNAVIGSRIAMAVSGAATINGTLKCILPAGFSAQRGDRFTLLSADSVTGQFVNAKGMVESEGHHFQILYTPASVELEKAL